MVSGSTNLFQITERRKPARNSTFPQQQNSWRETSRDPGPYQVRYNHSSPIKCLPYLQKPDMIIKDTCYEQGCHKTEIKRFVGL